MEKNFKIFMVLFLLFIKTKENINENEFDEDDDDDSTIKDEQVRRDITILSARLYDLRERFMKIIDKINHDSNEPLNQIPDTGK